MSSRPAVRNLVEATPVEGKIVFRHVPYCKIITAMDIAVLLENSDFLPSLTGRSFHQGSRDSILCLRNKGDGGTRILADESMCILSDVVTSKALVSANKCYHAQRLWIVHVAFTRDIVH